MYSCVWGSAHVQVNIGSSLGLEVTIETESERRMEGDFYISSVVGLLSAVLQAYGHYQEATLHLRHCLELRPGFEPAILVLRDMEALPDNNIHVYTVLIIIFLVIYYV